MMQGKHEYAQACDGVADDAGIGGRHDGFGFRVAGENVLVDDVNFFRVISGERLFDDDHAEDDIGVQTDERDIDEGPDQDGEQDGGVHGIDRSVDVKQNLIDGYGAENVFDDAVGDFPEQGDVHKNEEKNMQEQFEA